VTIPEAAYIYNYDIDLLKEFFLNRCIGQSPAESDDTRGCIYTIILPEDEQRTARNM
jgi:hypothetical protein